MTKTHTSTLSENTTRVQGASNASAIVEKSNTTTMLQLCKHKEDALAAEIYHCIDLVYCKK